MLGFMTKTAEQLDYEIDQVLVKRKLLLQEAIDFAKEDKAYHILEALAPLKDLVKRHTTADLSRFKALLQQAIDISKEARYLAIVEVLVMLKRTL